MKSILSITIPLCLVLVSSCASISPNTESKKHGVIDNAFEDTTDALVAAPSDDQILQSLIPDVVIGDKVEIIETRFDVSADQLPLNKFLLGLVDQTETNLLVDPNLNEPVTLHLKNVTISEVLSVLERSHDIDVQKSNSIYYVGGAKLQTVVYPLDYLNLQREGDSQTQVSSGQILSGNQNQNLGQQNSNNNQGANTGNTVTTINSSKIKTKSETDLWQEIQTALHSIVENESGSMVMASPQTGVVLVKARPMVQRQVADFLGIAQANLGRQVMLEAKILEVTLNENFQAGIDWSQVEVNGAGNLIALGQLGQVLDTTSEANPINGVFNLLYETDPNDPNPFSATVSLLEQQGDVQVLSSPRISTINNQKAVIKVGTDEFYVTDISTTTTSGISSTTTPDVTLTPFFSGIALDVMPQISASGEIILHVHPSVSEVNDQTKRIQIGDQDLTLPLALSSIRESDSIIKLKSGQVVVIGGLMQNQVIKTDSGVPLLSSIPLVGNLFTQQRDKVVKSELVLLLKATVMDNEGWIRTINDSHRRFESLR